MTMWSNVVKVDALREREPALRAQVVKRSGQI